MRVHNKGVMSRKADVYCCLLPGLIFCAGKQSLNNSCTVHLWVQEKYSAAIVDLIWFKYRRWPRWANRLSIMVCPVCVVGPFFEWIMIRWAVTRGTDGQRNISLSVYTSHYLSTLWACWWTGTSPLSKHGGSQRSEARHSSCQVAAERRAWSVSPCSLWLNLTIRPGPFSHMTIGWKCSHDVRKLLAFSLKMDLLFYLLLPSHLLLQKAISYFPFIAEITTDPLRKWLFVLWTQQTSWVMHKLETRVLI